MILNAEDRRLGPIGRRAAQELGFELVDAEVAKEPAGRFLRFYIDKAGGVTFEDCEAFHRAVHPLVENVEYDYLEVSSPGADRPLKTRLDFERSRGARVTVKLYRALDGQKVFSGALEGLSDDNILSLEGGRSFELKAVSSVRLEVDIEKEIENEPVAEIDGQVE